jgi:poly(A) polymerase
LAAVYNDGMAAAPDRQMHSTRPDAVEVVRVLRGAGHVALLAGGCVRDQLLGIEPKDFDVATDAHPQRVRQLFQRTQAVGQAFGVILVHVNRSVIEVATFRTDGNYTDGRRPDSVAFATAREDACRRDFTINGLFFDPIDHQVIDFVEGQADLRAGRIRAIGEPARRFAEDYLRLLRAARFAARFDFQIDADTRAAILAHAGRLARISPERIADELRAMLTVSSRARSARLLEELLLAAVIFRPLAVRPGASIRTIDQLPAAPVHFGIALACTLFDAVGVDSFDLFSPDFRRSVVRTLRTNLKLSNEETDQLTMILSIVELLEGDLTVARLKRFLARPFSQDAFGFANAISVHPQWTVPMHDLIRQADPFWAQDCAPTPLVNGDHLIAAGYPAGREFKLVLDAVYDAQLEHRISSHDQGMRMARSLFDRPTSH